jgi:hypothetical protein
MVASQATAEQFLASQGIKFRVVASKRGPGEWNVTFSRKGGGRLKLDVKAENEPDLLYILHNIWFVEPFKEMYALDEPEDAADYKHQLLSYNNARRFFTRSELTVLDMMDEEANP